MCPKDLINAFSGYQSYMCMDTMQQCIYMYMYAQGHKVILANLISSLYIFMVLVAEYVFQVYIPWNQMLMEPFFSSPTPLGASLVLNHLTAWARVLGCVPGETMEACFISGRGGAALCVFEREIKAT